MIVTGVALNDVEVIVRAVSATRYGGNLGVRTSCDMSSSRTTRCRFTLRVLDGHDGNPGAMGGANRTGTGPHGLKCSSLRACWHAHYDVLAVVFTMFPHARVKTAFAEYVARSFHAVAITTAGRNQGSPMCPAYATELCGCSEHPTQAETQDVVDEARYPADILENLGRYASDGAYRLELLANGRTDA